jgi:cytochrome b
MKKQHLIWDLPLRIFHWTFAATIVGCWATHELGSDYIDWHMRLGYTAMTLVLFRVVWGFVGTKHSKFKHFVVGPSSIFDYLKFGKSKSVGHNPLGSLMVVGMLFMVVIQSMSGLFVDDEIFTTGPYFNAFGDSVDDLMNTIHHNAFDVIGIAVALHIVAIIFYQKVKKQNLVKPMITGYKSSDDVSEAEGIKGSRIMLAVAVALLCAAFVYWLVVINAPPPADDFF